MNLGSIASPKHLLTLVVGIIPYLVCHWNLEWIKPTPRPLQSFHNFFIRGAYNLIHPRIELAEG
jgi:hypothetical protein